jgi:molybdopterin-guanine dinucleotide biosynthesis protein A
VGAAGSAGHARAQQATGIAGPVHSAYIAGIFVGGRSTRMGGRPKGLLTAPEGGTLVERCVRVLAAAGIDDVVLVGANRAYASLRLSVIEDTPPGTGPLGGLLALLAYASRAGAAGAIALACDMPFVSGTLLARLRAAGSAPIVAPRRAGRWEPLCARYELRAAAAGGTRVATGDYSLQRWLDDAGALELPLADDESEELRDWDAPGDLAAR